MKRRFLCLTLMSLLCIASHAIASGIETNGVGARATAMGGTFRAIADDWSAMYWNPAGLAFTKNWNAGLFAAFVMPRATFEPGPSHYYNLYGGAEFRQFSVAYQTDRQNESQTVLAPGAGVSYSTGKWAFGLSVFAPMGWAATWDVLRTASSNSGNIPGELFDGYNDAYPTKEYESDIRIIDVHPTVAYKLSEKLSLGLGLSLVYGEIGIRQPAFLQNPYLYERAIYRTLESISDGNAINILNEMRKPPFDHLITEAKMQSSGTTYGANFGLMYHVTDDLSLGASVQYYGDLAASGDYKQTTYFGDAPLYHSQAQAYTDSLFRKLYDAGLLDAEQFQIVSEFYSGQVVPRVDTKADVTIPLPIKAGIGFSYSGFKNLLLALDVNYVQWSVWDVLSIQEPDGVEISELVQNWNDTFKVGMGLEYTAGKTKLRGGFGYETRAAVDESVSPTIPDIGVRYNLNLGVAVPIGPLEVALNYEHIFIPDKEITTWVYDDLAVTQNIAGTYTMSANSVIFGINYAF